MARGTRTKTPIYGRKTAGKNPQVDINIARSRYDKIAEAAKDSMKALKDFKRKAEANPVTAEMAKYWSTLPSDHYMNGPI